MTVSVVLVTKDRPHFLDQSLASLAAQSVTPEVIVVRAAGDRTSTDVLARWDGLISQVVSASTGERATARNLGLEAATGKFVLFLDDDDLLTSGALELLSGTAEQRGAAIVRGTRELISPGTTFPWQPTMPLGDTRPRVATWHEVVVGREVLTPSQTLFRREVLVGLSFEERFVPIEDFVFGSRAAFAAGNFVTLPEVTTGYRIHPSQSGSRYSPIEVRQRQFQARQTLFDELSVDRRTRNRSMAHYHLYVDAAGENGSGKPWQMLPAVGRAALVSPAIVRTAMWWKALTLPARRSRAGGQDRRRGAASVVGNKAAVAKVQLQAQRWRQRLDGRASDSLVVSVVIPAHDEPIYLRQALVSLQGQSHQELDVIVVDDASDPPVADLVSSLGDPRIRCVRLDANRERAGARNVGLNAARGDFFMLLDHDDLLDPEAIENLVNTATRAHADVVFGRTESMPAATVPPWRSDSPRNLDHAEAIDWTEIWRFRWPIGNALYASWYIREIAFLHWAIPADDYKFAMEAAFLGRAVKGDFPVAGWRQHPRQTSASLDDRAVSQAVKRAQDVVLATYSIVGPTRRHMLGYRALYQDGYVAWRSGDWPRLARAALSSAWSNPGMLGDVMWWKAIGSASKQALRRPSGRAPAMTSAATDDSSDRQGSG